MSYIIGPITLGASGTAKAFSVGFQPTWARLIVGGKSNDTVSHNSYGSVDSTGYTYCISNFMDTSGGVTVNYNYSDTVKKLISHRERINGNIEVVLDADFNSFYSSGIKLNVNTANTSYQVLLECGN